MLWKQVMVQMKRIASWDCQHPHLFGFKCNMLTSYSLHTHKTTTHCGSTGMLCSWDVINAVPQMECAFPQLMCMPYCFIRLHL